MAIILRRRKQLIRGALVALLLVDVVLIGINWRMATAPRPDQSALTLLKRQRDLLAADVARGERIRKDLPAVEQQCDAFFKEQLPAEGKAYSAIVDNLGEVARAAGLRAGDVTFNQHNPDNRGVLLVEIGATVNGDYPSVVRFINGLERSKNFYVLDELSLAAGSGGNLRLNLRLRTYFRT
jgi:hypothetical protein